MHAANATGERDALWFPGWSEVLAEADLPPNVRTRHRREIMAFLRFCRKAHAPATAILARQFIERATDEPSRTREALRWLFRTARDMGCRTTSSDNSAASPRVVATHRVPPPAREDRGDSPWERGAAQGSQEFLGHQSVETTQIYTHVMQKPGLGVRSGWTHP
jgi:hypothetical protein